MKIYLSLYDNNEMIFLIEIKIIFFTKKKVIEDMGRAVDSPIKWLTAYIFCSYVSDFLEIL